MKIFGKLAREASSLSMVSFPDANNDHLVVKVFPRHDLEVSFSAGFVLSFWIMLKHFKVYITITDIMGEKKINPAYLIQGKEVAIIRMFSNNIQYGIREPVKVLLIMNEEKMLPEKMFLDRNLNTSVGRKVITTPLDTNDNIIKGDKLACVTKVVISLDELDNTDNLEDGRLSNVLLRYHVTGSEKFTSHTQYKRLKNGEFTSLTLRIMDQKDNSITDGLGMAIILHIR